MLDAGFIAGETWLPFAYDWRLPLRECARLLRDEIVRASDRAGGPVDAIGFSTGGLALRAAVSCEFPHGPGMREMATRVSNLLFAGTPQRGALDGALCLHRGDRLAPMGRWIEPDEMAGVGGSFDSMPWGRGVFRDDRGAPLAWDLYDVATWRAFSMGIFAGVSRTTWRFVGSHRFAPRSAPDDAMVARFTASLAEARAFQQSIESDAAFDALSRTRLHVIGGSARPTATWLVVHNGRACDPRELPFRARHAVRYGLAAGDGLVDDASMRALPVPFSVTRIAGALHRTLITQPALHAAALAAITACSRSA